MLVTAILNLCIPMVFQCMSENWSTDRFSGCKELYAQCVIYHENKALIKLYEKGK
jgi:hypothetical protein